MRPVFVKGRGGEGGWDGHGAERRGQAWTRTGLCQQAKQAPAAQTERWQEERLQGLARTAARVGWGTVLQRRCKVRDR